MLFVFFLVPKIWAGKTFSFPQKVESTLGLKIEPFAFDFVGKTFVSTSSQEIMFQYEVDDKIQFNPKLLTEKDLLVVRSLHQQTVVAFFKFSADKQKQLQFHQNAKRLIASYETTYKNEALEKRYLLECISISSSQKYVSMTSSSHFSSNLQTKFMKLCEDL